MKDLEIIVPVFNEKESVEHFVSVTEPYCRELNVDYRFIFVNDGSYDGTDTILDKMVSENNKVTVIHLSRNFGKEAALTAGIEYSNSRTIIPMDVDMQDPPELIVELYEKYLAGANVVLAVRQNRDTDSWLKRTSAGWFYSLMNKIGDLKLTPNAGDFRLIDDKVISIIKKMPERTRFMKGILSWPGFKVDHVYYVRPERHDGQTKWNPVSLWKLALDGIFSFSNLPLKLWFYLGSMISVLSMLYMTFIIFKVLFFGVDVPGYASLVVIILFMGGVNLIGLGVLGEYISRIFVEVKGRPVYVVDRVSNGSSESHPDNIT